MATNERGYGKRVRVTAAANRTSGAFVVEDGFHGLVTVDVTSGDDYALNIEQREFEVTLLSGADRGELVYIDGSNALTLTASTNRLIGKVTRVAGQEGVPSGKMCFLLLPNTVA